MNLNTGNKIMVNELKKFISENFPKSITIKLPLYEYTVYFILPKSSNLDIQYFIIKENRDQHLHIEIISNKRKNIIWLTSCSMSRLSSSALTNYLKKSSTRDLESVNLYARKDLPAEYISIKNILEALNQ